MPRLRTARASFVLSMLVASATVVPTVGAAARIGPERISVATGGAQANTDSYECAVSSNGKIVAFRSDATDLVTGDTNGFGDIFVRDRKSGATTRVSVSTAGAEANGASSHVGISANGRFVAFASFASNLVSGDTNGANDVFVHDRTTGETRRVSVATGGAEGNGGSFLYDGCISANGLAVVFHSAATNFFTGDFNQSDDVFAHDLKSGTTTYVSNGLASGANGSSFAATISGNGRFVAFTSGASNLISGDNNARDDVFVRNLKAGTTVRASESSSDGASNGPSTGEPSISANGKFVAFSSDATGLVEGDANGLTDVFVKDLKSRKTVRVSVASGGAEATGGASQAPAISGNGKTVVFYSNATDLVTGDTNARSDVFVHDVKRRTTRRVSVDAQGQEANQRSFSSASSLTSNGKLVVYFSDATNLVAGDTNGVSDVFLVGTK